MTDIQTDICKNKEKVQNYVMTYKNKRKWQKKKNGDSKKMKGTRRKNVKETQKQKRITITIITEKKHCEKRTEKGNKNIC